MAQKKKIRGRKSKPSRQQPPFGAALALAKIFHACIDQLAEILDRNVVRTWSQNPKLKNQRTDASNFDIGLRKTKRDAKKIFDDKNLEPKIDLISSRIDKKNGIEMKRIIPVSIYKEVGGKKIVAKFRSECINKCKEIVGSELDTLSDIVDEAGENGMRVEDLAKKIGARLDVTQSKATLLARDQTLKFNAKLTQARQTQSGITSYTWSTSGDERVREMHADLDGEICDWDDPPETNDDGDTNHPGEDYQCVPGDSEIQFARGIRKYFRRLYRGQMTELVTDSGKALRATPNHPVLTQRGWLPMKSIQKGDYVFELAEQASDALRENQNDREPTIAKIFCTAEKTGVLQSRDVRSAELHGDVGEYRNVDVVSTARHLRIDIQPDERESLGQFRLAVSNHFRATFGQFGAVILAMLCSLGRSVRSRCELHSLFARRLAHSLIHAFAPIALPNAGTTQAIDNHDSCDAETFRDRENAFSTRVRSNDLRYGDVEKIGRRTTSPRVGVDADSSELLAEIVGMDPDSVRSLEQFLPFAHKRSRVIDLFTSEFFGHVYNLETQDGWFLCNGYITKNCRCVAIPVLPDEDTDEESTDESE